MRYYDMDGKPITAEQWADRLAEDRHVGDTQVGDLWVSTVWLGLDHNFYGGDSPLIFETMVFRRPDPPSMDREDWGDEEFSDRYSTKEQALAGHQRVVEAVERGELP